MPQIVPGVNPKTMPTYKTIADLKGKKVNVTAPGSSTNVMLDFVLARAGQKPTDVSVIGVGADNGAVAAMRTGQIDAISKLEPPAPVGAATGLRRVGERAARTPLNADESGACN